MLITRRQVLISISQLAAATVLASCSDSKQTTTSVGSISDLELLASVTYDFLPYPELPIELYIKAAERMLNLKSATITEGLQQLRGASDRVAQNSPWVDIPEFERIAILSSFEGSPFFTTVRTNTLQVLLREPDTFNVVGYGGPSIKYGGYLNRGFNDIDWLPSTNESSLNKQGAE